jgi:cell surface protein SprA
MNRDTIWDEVLSFGTKTRYNQSVRVNYTVPINKIPLLNWVTVSAGYQGGYTWLASPLSVQERIGNSIENQNTKQLNGNMDFVKLYNKIGYLKTLNTPQRSVGRGGPAPRPGAVRPGAKPQEEEGNADSTNTKPAVNYFKIVADQVLKLVMSVKKANLNYTQNNGMFLPGFLPEPDIFGLNLAASAPGVGFVLGDEADIRSLAVDNDWLTRDSLLNRAFAKKFTETFSYKINLEPLPGLRIDINADRTYARNFQEYFRADSMGVFQSFSPTETGNFSMSYGMWATSFVKARSDESSELFDKLLSNRIEIANRLAYGNAKWVEEGESYVYDSVGQAYYPRGYGAISPQVVLYSFLAAYGGKNPKSISLNPFPKTPIPNWTINYNGLTKIPFIQRLFKTVNITHAYRSAYSINTWRTNVDYDPENTTKTYRNSNMFIPQYDIGQVTISEQFAPLIGVDLGLHNSLTARIEYKKQRNLTLSFINNQLTEVVGDEIIIGAGYRLRNLSFIVSSLTGGNATRASNDLILKLDLGFRTDKTTLRRIDEQNSQVSAGQRKINIYVTADYTFSNRLSMQAYFRRDMSDPFVSSQFKNSNTAGGITMRFNLAQ